MIPQKRQGVEYLKLIKKCFICVIILLLSGCQEGSTPPDTIVEVHESSEDGRLTTEIHNVTSSKITDIDNYFRIYPAGSSSALLDIKMLGQKEISADSVAIYTYDLIGEDQLGKYINNDSRFVFRVTGKYKGSPFVVETPSIIVTELVKDTIIKKMASKHANLYKIWVFTENEVEGRKLQGSIYTIRQQHKEKVGSLAFIYYPHGGENSTNYSKLLNITKYPSFIVFNNTAIVFRTNDLKELNQFLLSS